MSSASDIFFTSIGCMDGRVQAPIAKFGEALFGAFFPDTITEAGLVALLAKDVPDQALISSITRKINISLEKHHSRGIVVHGHEDCAGNPVDNQKHKEDVLKATHVIKSIVPEGVRVIPVFIKKEGFNWIAEEIKNS